ncbi:MAG: plasmid pRiA4b ORF-3 family protein [Euryarchaeota archaeon]|nr:plasmid pRiA4b ORF-3 family protein [Euryarchaeota archaeon]
MKKTFEKVYQLKLSMKGITPQIWRRIQVPENYTFLKLHDAIQVVMDWYDYHLHEFEMINPKTGATDIIGMEGVDFEDFRENFVPEKKAKISNYFTPENKEALYLYDFGDNWMVKVRLEKILPREEGIEYPICTAGKRAAVPEDVGGIWGYEEMLEILKDPEHEEYEDTVSWLGGDFDPEYFDPKDVSF